MTFNFKYFKFNHHNKWNCDGGGVPDDEIVESGYKRAFDVMNCPAKKVLEMYERGVFYYGNPYITTIDLKEILDA